MERTQFNVGLLQPVRDAALVAVQGDIDIYTAPLLQEALDDAFATGAPRLIVDLSDVPFIDSSGLGVLVAEIKRQRSRGATLEVVCQRANTTRIFEVTGLLGTFVLWARREEALTNVQDSAG